MLASPACVALKAAEVPLCDCGVKPGALQNRKREPSVPVVKVQATVWPRAIEPLPGVHEAMLALDAWARETPQTNAKRAAPTMDRRTRNNQLFMHLFS